MDLMTMMRASAAALMLAGLATTPAAAQKPFADVGKQAPITILVASTPWYPAFEKVVGLYEQQTGNQIKLDTTPFGGMLEKARNAVRSGKSPYDLMFLDTQWTIEFYEGGFLAPLKEIDASFDLPKEVLSYGDSGWWNAQKRWRTPDGGKLMAYTVLGNVQLLYYRADILKQAGIAPPKTWADVLTACTKLTDPPKMYGFVARGEKGNGIRYDWHSVMLAEGGSVVKDPAAGDYTVTINSPQVKAALDLYTDLLKKCGPPNYGTLGTAKRGSLKGPGTWVVNLAFYKDLFRTRGATVEFTALLDNAFDHPQFFVPDLGTGGFVDLTDSLINGIADNGTTGVLGADTVGNTEGFAAGRVVRFGVRLRF